MTLNDIMSYRIASAILALFILEEMFHKPIKSKFVSVMNFIQLVSDQAVYKYIEEALFEDKSRWNRIKGVLGAFHTEFSYLNALGKIYSGSGIEDLAL